MRQILLVLCLLGVCHNSCAAPSSIWWPGWKVSSSEELSAGMKYSRNASTPTYPLSRMFDNDPTTAWVYSSTSKEWDTTTFKTRYGVELTPTHAITIDGLRLMNGQNESRARFLRNDRATQIRVTLDTARGEVVRISSLAEQMGWQTVALPSTLAKGVKIEFTRIQPGTGPGNDLCIAEIALMSAGQPIDMRMPRAVMFNDGLEGCNASFLILGTGQYLDGIASDAGYTDEWSPNARYVCGVTGSSELWIADARRGKIVRRLASPDRDFTDYKWEGNNTLRVTSTDDKKWFYKTIKLP